MSIKTSEIKEGYKYKTPNNQERIVLGVNEDGVTYASRGGNVQNKWEKQRNTSTLKRFAETVRDRKINCGSVRNFVSV